MKTLKTISYLLVVFSSCQPVNENNVKIASTGSEKGIDTASLRKKLENARKVVDDKYEILFNNDTLKIVSAMDDFYYPFGKHANVVEIAKQINGAIIKKVRSHNSNNNGSTEVSQIVAAKSQVKFYYDEEQQRQQVVSADIYDTNFRLNNNIKIGMSKEKFLSIYFNKPPLIFTDIVKFISAIDGIEHYYYFVDNKLKRIKMVTDYMFDDK